MLSFNGRASKREFWLIVGPVLLWNLALLWLLDVTFPNGVRSPIAAVFVLLFLIMLPDAFGAAAIVRRLHDIGRSGFWTVAATLPIKLIMTLRDRADDGWERGAWMALATAIVAAGVAYVGLSRGVAGDNRFGPDPLAGPAAPPA